MGELICGLFGRELRAEEEIALGRAIREAERRLVGVLGGVPQLRPILERRASRRYQTHAAQVERLEDAVTVLQGLARVDPTLAAAAAEAERCWSEAEAHRWRLAMSQQRLAVHEARKHAGRLGDRADLAQEGILGLLRAARRFDPERGLRFATYARWWVRAQIGRAVDQHGRMVRLPGTAVEELRDLRRTHAELAKGGGMPSVAEVADRVGIDVARAEMLLSQGDSVSIDAAARDSEAPALQLADDAAVDALDRAMTDELTVRALAAVAELPARQRDVLRVRYGLDGTGPRSLSEVARDWAISREGVRQIERRAISAVHARMGVG